MLVNIVQAYAERIKNQIVCVRCEVFIPMNRICTICKIRLALCLLNTQFIMRKLRGRALIESKVYVKTPASAVLQRMFKSVVEQQQQTIYAHSMRMNVGISNDNQQYG